MPAHNIAEATGFGQATSPVPRTLVGAARLCFPGHTAGAFKLRARFVLAGLAHYHRVRPFLSPPPETMLAHVMSARPETIGALVWPYQCAAWGPGTRLMRILAHYREIDRAGPPLRFAADEKLVIHDWPEADGLRLVLDQPKWFLREGGLALNLFQGDFRAMTIAFSLYRTDAGGLDAMIGSVQGRNRDGILDLYRDLTKRMHGLRPRDLLFECFRALCQPLGVERILAVADEERHHRHPYFGKTTFPLDYNEIWEDRGGRRIDGSTFELPLARTERDMSEIRPKKRPQYRRRYEFLAGLEAALPAGIAGARPCRFTDT